MKLKDFDYRLWDNDQKKYLKYEGFGWEDYSRKVDYYIGKDSEEKIVIANCLVCCDDVDFYHLDNSKNYEEYEIELWTGLKDSKGNKIYEGDIVSYKGQNLLVSYERATWYLINPLIDKDIRIDCGVRLQGILERMKYHDKIDTENQIDIEVIGNIHEEGLNE